MRRRPAATAGIYLAAVGLGLFSALPFAWMVLTALKPRAEVLTAPPTWWPSALTLDSFRRALDAGLARALLNSLLVAGGVTVAAIVISALAAYAFARLDVPFKRYLLLVMLSVQMFPLVVLLVPYFIVMRNAGLLDSRLGLVIAYLSFTVPLGTWILRDFIATLPEELEEAAMVDGTSRVGAMWRITLPLAGPGLAACAILSFVTAWNEFLLALTFIKDEGKRTAPVALTAFFGRASDDWGAIMAASVLATLPVIVFFVLLHRRLVRGMTLGAVKG